MLAFMTGRSLRQYQVGTGPPPQTEPKSQTRRGEEYEIEKKAQIQRRRAVEAINSGGVPSQSSARAKVFWAVSIVKNVGLPLNKKGLRELQKLTHPDKQAMVDRADAHRAFQILDQVEEGLRDGGYL